MPDFGIEIVDEKILKITDNGCTIEVPIKRSYPQKGCSVCSFRKSGKCIIDYYKSSYTSILCSRLLGAYRGFDVAEESFRVLSKLLTDTYDRKPGLVKKKRIFRRSV